MPHINLLPWREELRRRRNKEFGILAGVVAVAMGGVVFGVHTWYQNLIDVQNGRNQYLQQQISLLDKKIKEIKDLEAERDSLIKRKDKIEELQAGRPDIVHLMDELVMVLPEGVYYTSIEQKGAKLKVTGVAQSNARVSSLMRKIDSSKWLESPNLVEIKANAQAVASEQIKLSTFSLNFQQKPRKKPEEPSS